VLRKGFRGGDIKAQSRNAFWGRQARINHPDRDFKGVPTAWMIAWRLRENSHIFKRLRDGILGFELSPDCGVESGFESAGLFGPIREIVDKFLCAVGINIERLSCNIRNVTREDARALEYGSSDNFVGR
jgi:hypothetical protein